MSSNSITIFCPWQSNRLSYILHWVFKEVFHTAYHLVHDENAVRDLPFFIAYGKIFPNAFTIPDEGLLSQEGHTKITVPCGIWQTIPTLFSSKQEGFSLPFDIFSASFFLLTRYEEYYAHTPDKHGRYPATESILYKMQWLQRPLVDEWLFALYLLLQNKFSLGQLPPYQYHPTYDIDIAWSYKHKGLKRAIGSSLRDVLRGDITSLKKRINVLRGKAIDPYDCFDWLQDLHQKHDLIPHYFILAALKTTAYDKNNLPTNIQMQSLIKRLSEEGNIGLHPSYYSTSEAVFVAEKNILSKLTKQTITQSRQHYIKLQTPTTYRYLLAQGIVDDYSMGYGSHLGFRAGSGRSFLWFDIVLNEATPLRIHPFCFMDSTAHFEEKLTAEEAFFQLKLMELILRKTQSQLTTVFHNFSLGSDAQWIGWQVAYQGFIAAQG